LTQAMLWNSSSRCQWPPVGLYARRDEGRHIAEVFAAAVQFAGSVTHYAPGVAEGEPACWLSFVDRSCGFMWLAFPVVLLRRQSAAARSGAVKQRHFGGDVGQEERKQEKEA